MKTIFWNVDTQYDFMRDDDSHKGKLNVPNARGIEAQLGYLTKLAQVYDKTRVLTADWHHKDSAEFSDKPDFQTTYPPHCLMHTKGAEFIPAVKPGVHAYNVFWDTTLTPNADIEAHKEVIIYKDAFDVFAGNKNTDAVVNTINPDRAIVYGVATNVCVDYAVMGLKERGVDVIVPTDAIKELPGLPLDATLHKWEKAGVKLTKTTAIEDYL